LLLPPGGKDKEFPNQSLKYTTFMLTNMICWAEMQRKMQLTRHIININS
jgi:hypothetical protein